MFAHLLQKKKKKWEHALANNKPATLVLVDYVNCNNGQN